MKNKIRLDQALVAKNWAKSRTQAQQMIQEGLISNAIGVPLLKASHLLDEDQIEQLIRLQPKNSPQFVSRAGIKMQGALEHLKLNVTDFSVLDVGMSTGGFSDCLLQSGASHVLGIDVGHNQVDPHLVARFDSSKLTIIEGLNARYLSADTQFLSKIPPLGFDLIIMDVSFISIHLILPELIPFIKPGGLLLSLVKPQFEVGPSGLGKNGIVKDPQLYLDVQKKITEKCVQLELKILDYFDSSIIGKDGNREFFVYAKKAKN